MIRYEDNCHNCPECIGCGRKKKEPVLCCDKCGESITEDFACQVDYEGCFCRECTDEVYKSRMDAGNSLGIETQNIGFWLD